MLMKNGNLIIRKLCEVYFRVRRYPTSLIEIYKTYFDVITVP